MIKVAIADDHELVRRGVRQVLELDPDVDVVAEAKNAWDVLKCIATGGINVLLLDIGMPGPSGVELIRRVKTDAPEVGVLVLSVHADPQIATRAIKAGACGYLTKDSDAGILLEAVRMVSKGSKFIEAGLATQLVFNAQSAEALPHSLLSSREYQVFLALVSGRSLTEISQELYLSAKTISTHKSRLMHKLGVGTVSELVRYAVRQGIVS